MPLSNKTKQVVARAMRMETEKKIEALSEIPNKIFKFLKMMKRGKDVKYRKCSQDIDGRLGIKDIDKKR